MSKATLVAIDELFRNGQHLARVTIEVDILDLGGVEGMTIADGLEHQVKHVVLASKEAQERRAREIPATPAEVEAPSEVDGPPPPTE